MATQVHPPLNPNNITPRSESIVYKALRDQLDDDYEVIYSQDFSYQNDQNNRRYGEIDFVIWHPRRGVLVLEVKGGCAIEKDTNGTWRSQRHDNGTWHSIKDPFDQANRAMRKLTNEIEHRLGNKLQAPHAFACVFPGAKVNSDMPIGRPSEVCIDARAMNQLNSAVKGAFRAVADPFRDLSPEGQQKRDAELETVWNELTRTFRMIPAGDVASASTRKATINRGREIYYQLTERQAELYYETLQANPRVLVRGPAGTGKTLLAENRAKQLAREGKKTLLLCYNKLLAQHLSEQTEDIDNLDTRYFHEIIERNIIHTKRRQMPTRPDDAFWVEESSDLLLEIIENRGIQYDALVVDEAQDIYSNWWEALQFLLSEDPYVYVFADIHQNIYGPQLSVDTVWDDMPLIRIVQNCRSVRRVAEYAADLRGVTPLYHHPSLVDGVDVEEYTYNSADEQVDILDTLVQELRDDGFEANQIILLGMHSKKNSALADVDRLAGYTLKPFDMADPPTNQELAYSTAQRFKGLDAPIVIVYGLDADCDYATHINFMYVACTRAQDQLHLVHHKDWSPPEAADPGGDGALA